MIPLDYIRAYRIFNSRWASLQIMIFSSVVDASKFKVNEDI